MIDLERLCRKLNYKFQNKTLLKQALTHCSMGDHNNERLEFLGDSILSMVIAQALFNKFPDQKEGQLSRLRAFLVKGDMLAIIAHELDLGQYLYLGQGELKSGGFRRASILADALEAIFAAVFLDNGFAASQQVILHLYQSRLNQVSLANHVIDAKTQLQEYLQSKKLTLPKYTLTQVLGDEHEQVFFVACTVPDMEITTEGQGETRRKAEQQAAEKLLASLQNQLKTS